MATPEKKILVLTHGRDIHGYALKVLMEDCQVDILPIEKVQGNVTIAGYPKAIFYASPT